MLCYCETCHRLRGEDGTASAGDPNKKYGLPLGWCMFPLKIRQRGASGRGEEEQESWHRAFHGTDAGFVRKIMDRGKLMTQGELGLERRLGRPGNSKEDDIDTPLIYFSPSINYVGRTEFSPARKFADSKTKKTYSARTSLLVEVQPGSYKVSKN